MKSIILVVVSVLMLLAFTVVAQAEPLGYPWSTWGEITQTLGDTDVDQGFKLDGYVEQGVDWTKVGAFTLNTFVGLRGTVSDHSSEYWNNKWGPWIGLKMKLDGKPFSSQSWSNLAVGVRWEYVDYFQGHNDTDSRGVVFLQWGLGGDWKK